MTDKRCNPQKTKGLEGISYGQTQNVQNTKGHSKPYNHEMNQIRPNRALCPNQVGSATWILFFH